jgi:hypothetical protein
MLPTIHVGQDHSLLTISSMAIPAMTWLYRDTNPADFGIQNQGAFEAKTYWTMVRESLQCPPLI